MRNSETVVLVYRSAGRWCSRAFAPGLCNKNLASGLGLTRQTIRLTIRPRSPGIITILPHSLSNSSESFSRSTLTPVKPRETPPYIYAKIAIFLSILSILISRIFVIFLSTYSIFEAAWKKKRIERESLAAQNGGAT